MYNLYGFENKIVKKKNINLQKVEKQLSALKTAVFKFDHMTRLSNWLPMDHFESGSSITAILKL